MAYGLGNQLEPDLDKRLYWNPEKPWRVRRRSAFRVFLKKGKARSERRRAKRDPGCQPLYKCFAGGEY